MQKMISEGGAPRTDRDKASPNRPEGTLDEDEALILLFGEGPRNLTAGGSFQALTQLRQREESKGVLFALCHNCLVQ